MISGRNPDVAVVLRGTPKDERGRRPPALAVEVVSEGGEARDYETKRQEYLVYGLREYWIVDPQTRRVTVLSRDGDVWVERVFQGDQTIESHVLPGFEGRVADLWLDAEADRRRERVMTWAGTSRSRKAQIHDIAYASSAASGPWS